MKIQLKNKMAKKEETKKTKKKGLVETPECNDRYCPNCGGSIKARGKIFEGKVIKKFQRRLTIHFERRVYVRKYERYLKKDTKIHARLPECMKKDIEIGDIIQVRECRPLSKIIHFVVIKKIKDAEVKK